MSTIRRVSETNIKKIANNKYSITNSLFYKEFLSAEIFESKVKDDTIYFKASSVQTLAQYLIHKPDINFDFCTKMIYDLGSFLLFTERNNQGLIYFNLEDIIVINDYYFLFLNSDLIYSLNSQDKLNITYPFNKSEFLAPELTNAVSLPMQVHKSVSYYSLACIVLHCLQVDIEKIKATKLYFFLKRCLNNDPTKRELFYI